MEVVELTGTLNVMQTGDLESGENRTMMTARLLSPPHHAPVTSLLISSNKLMSASWDKTIKVWDLSKSELPFVKDLATHSDYVTCLAASDNVIVSGSRDCQILVWSADLSASKQLHIASPNPSFAMANWVLSLAIANNHIYAGFKDETVQVWNEQSLAYLGSLGAYPTTLLMPRQFLRCSGAHFGALRLQTTSFMRDQGTFTCGTCLILKN